MRRIALLVVISFAFFMASEAKAQTLTVTGTCPGVMNFDVTGAQPFSRLAFIYSLNTGSWTIPSPLPCAGLTTGLSAPVSLGAWVLADFAGNANVNAFIPPAWCGTRFIQVVDTLSCTTTSVFPVP